MILTTNINPADATLVAILGYGVVFVGLILLMVVILALGKAFSAKKTKAVVVETAPAETLPETPVPVAPGSAGELKLNNVPPKTAAMVMAIVADKMGKPLNELRFLSIREVE